MLSISIRHVLTLARHLDFIQAYGLNSGGCFRVDNVSDGNLNEVACALNTAQNKAGYYVYSVLRPPRQPSPTRSRASASHCTTSRPPRCYRMSRYIIYPPQWAVCGYVLPGLPIRPTTCLAGLARSRAVPCGRATEGTAASRGLSDVGSSRSGPRGSPADVAKTSASPNWPVVWDSMSAADRSH